MLWDPYGPLGPLESSASWSSYTTRLPGGCSMIRLKSARAGVAAAVLLTIVLTASLSPSSQADAAGARAATGVGSCPLKKWNPSGDPADQTDLPEGQRPQTHKPD